MCGNILEFAGPNLSVIENCLGGGFDITDNQVEKFPAMTASTRGAQV